MHAGPQSTLSPSSPQEFQSRPSGASSAAWSARTRTERLVDASVPESPLLDGSSRPETHMAAESETFIGSNDNFDVLQQHNSPSKWPPLFSSQSESRSIFLY